MLDSLIVGSEYTKRANVTNMWFKKKKSSPMRFSAKVFNEIWFPKTLDGCRFLQTFKVPKTHLSVTDKFS